MKKLAVFVLCAVLALSLAACGGTSPASSSASAASGSSAAPASSGSLIGSVQIPNPITECADMAAAEKLTGFSMTLPETVPAPYESYALSTISDTLIQAVWSAGDEELCIRKAADPDGSLKDSSGDYTDYSEVNTVTVGSLTVTEKGAGGLVNVAIWSDGGYAYSIRSQKTGLDAAAVASLVGAVR